MFQDKFFLQGENNELFYVFKRRDIPYYYFAEVDYQKMYQAAENYRLRPLALISKSEQQVANLDNFGR
jgi:hypothetical protein